jgi:hypothetical protein
VGPVSSIPAEETPTDIGPALVDGAAACREEIAAIFNDQFVMSRKGEVKANGTEFPEPFVLVPGEVDAGEGTAAFAATADAPAVIVYRTIEQHAMFLWFIAAEELHVHASLPGRIEAGGLHCPPHSQLCLVYIRLLLIIQYQPDNHYKQRRIA